MTPVPTPPLDTPRDCAPRPPVRVEHRASESAAIGVTVNTLDRAGRIVATAHDLDGDGRPEQTEHLAYDAAGRLATVTQDDRTIRTVRDREGRVVLRETVDRDGAVVAQVALQYDERGRLAHELDGLDDRAHAYDDRGCEVREQRTRVGEAVPFIDLAMACDAGGHRVSQQGNDGTSAMRETWRYERGLVVRDTLEREGAVVLDTITAYDGAGRRRTAEHRDGTGAPTSRQTWTYDAAGRLATEQTDDLRDASWTRDTYVYDGATCGRPLKRIRI